MKLKEKLALLAVSLFTTAFLWLCTRVLYFRTFDVDGRTAGWHWVQEYFFWIGPLMSPFFAIFFTIAMIVAGLITLGLIVYLFIDDPDDD